MNDAWWWSWLLTIVGITGFHLVGKKIWWAWYINIACQFLWLTYAIVTEQYGFIAASVFYFIVFTNNARKWTKEHREKIARIDEMIKNDIDYTYSSRGFDMPEGTLTAEEAYQKTKDTLERANVFVKPTPEDWQSHLTFKERGVSKEDWAESEMILGHIICWGDGEPHHYEPDLRGVGNDGGDTLVNDYCAWGGRHEFTPNVPEPPDVVPLSWKTTDGNPHPFGSRAWHRWNDTKDLNKKRRELLDWKGVPREPVKHVYKVDPDRTDDHALVFSCTRHNCENFVVVARWRWLSMSKLDLEFPYETDFLPMCPVVSWSGWSKQLTDQRLSKQKPKEEE